MNPALSGLPAFLTGHGGLQSGLMMAQVTAAALTSEIKTLAHPASVDTIPTSANKEDHVSMSMGAALKAERALQLARSVMAIEMLCACQAIDLLRAAHELAAADARARAPCARSSRRSSTTVRRLPIIDAIAAVDRVGRARVRDRHRCQLNFRFAFSV